MHRTALVTEGHDIHGLGRLVCRGDRDAFTATVTSRDSVFTAVRCKHDLN
jgi:hypothetical protein